MVAYKERIKVRSVIHKRGILTDGTCLFGCGVSETVDHFCPRMPAIACDLGKAELKSLHITEGRIIVSRGQALVHSELKRGMDCHSLVDMARPVHPQCPHAMLRNAGIVDEQSQDTTE